MKARSSSSTTVSTAPRRDLFQDVTDRILSVLAQGQIPWRKPWRPKQADIPRNWKGRPYSGINFFLLSIMGYETPVFLTFKQAKALGGTVKKGEKGHLVVFWKFFTPSSKDAVADDATEDADAPTKKRAMLKHYTVFNVSQCEGIPEIAKPETDLVQDFDPIQQIEAMIEAMPQRPPITNDGGAAAFYRPSSDSVHMPAPETFLSPSHYYATLFHELGHSTGHQSRLARDLSGKFGSKEYAREELTAELEVAPQNGARDLISFRS